ncbi:hypothetical protein GCM10023189_33480 [Nibrella saemangeumensis]|uniref:Uncharacterized protein n=1 Tax=Nibrella saemangeumensis TaxID=1084526 RepID=A0ABP8N5I7_9BACT
MEPYDDIESTGITFSRQFVAFFPRLIGALLLLLIGWLIARAVRWGVEKLLKAIRFDNLTAKVGIDTFLRKGGIQHSSSHLFATMIYWILMLIVFEAFFNSLGLEIISGLLNDIILYVPNIIVAIVILVIGMYLADFVRGLVVAALRNANIAQADLIGLAVRALVIFLVFAIALSQLRIAEDIITSVVTLVLGAFCLALAIAFGFGARDWAADIVNRYVRNPQSGPTTTPTPTTRVGTSYPSNAPGTSTGTSANPSDPADPMNQPGPTQP